MENDTIRKEFTELSVSRKVKMFTLHLLSNVFPTKQAIHSRIRKDERVCVFCDCEDETVLHLFLFRPFARLVAFLGRCLPQHEWKLMSSARKSSIITKFAQSLYLIVLLID